MSKNISPLQQVLNVWAIILIIWSVYRTKVLLPEWFDEFIAKPVVFILPVYIFIKKFEQKPFLQQIWLKIHNSLGDIYISLFLGGVFASSALFANYARYGDFQFAKEFFSNKFLIVLLIPFATSISEEILSRGFILKRLYEDSKNMYSSSFLASILFLILHIPILFTIPGLSGSLLLLFLATDFILSLVNSFIYLDRKSLLAPILIHAFYNIAILLYI
ncbi:hypothetical protein A2862_02035 [Candidatus Roizmanbacteria bacterium RIFCSPHIGHO2_01_FULL_38_41]|nr:MAG: hypothetical protein A2862_02035 [Candidatus Roizmanbacteria bacterium RIFCSPHIGHO2_01_FULL_38_41]OGK32814.1 MAG: hypothetical protein A3E10_03430 [Candidatus Roizmanbacteria bacterium RIFCSPHIGHO2_12_FULL_37_23]OGK45176.1 MAG: hypothetical protein A2956_03210 [Candidatus Roizmanbacteria bacterium RIFCSPLOWO2_01_FULL_37_57]OGK61263.1 MAG: hypothetical protein A3G65_04000 [Candidatus Roizmanbacteria bacterium RIFCSPLOWO2_12_FULL_37_7b]